MMEFLKKFIEWLFKLIFGEPPKRPEIPKPEPKIPTKEEKPTPPQKPYLKCIRTTKKAYNDLDLLNLSLISADGSTISSWPMVSGIPGRQNFRLPKDSVSGSLEPLPQGKYTLGPIEWKGKPYDWSIKWETPGLGALWIALNAQFQTSRSGFGVHRDDNANISPGSAGCLVNKDLGIMEDLVKAIDKYKPEYLLCDWSLDEKKPTTTKKIALDVGHGANINEVSGVHGFEPGAQGPGFTEHDAARIMYDHVRLNLEKAGYLVTKVNGDDTLEGRGKQGEGHDCFVSLHCNAFDKKTQGSEVIVHTNATQKDEALAHSILKEIVAELKLHNRGVKNQNLAVLRGVPMSVQAAVLVEPFFIDSLTYKEEVLSFSQRAGKAIAAGIQNYLKSLS